MSENGTILTMLCDTMSAVCFWYAMYLCYTDQPPSPRLRDEGAARDHDGDDLGPTDLGPQRPGLW